MVAQVDTHANLCSNGSQGSEMKTIDRPSSRLPEALQLQLPLSAQPNSPSEGSLRTQLSKSNVVQLRVYSSTLDTKPTGPIARLVELSKQLNW